jgi:hypothetical protein
LGSEFVSSFNMDNIISLANGGRHVRMLCNVYSVICHLYHGVNKKLDTNSLPKKGVLPTKDLITLFL